MSGSHNQWEGVSIPPPVRKKLRYMLDEEDMEISKLNSDRESLKQHAAAYLTEFFGKKCPDFNPACECCRRWKAFEVLFETI